MSNPGLNAVHAFMAIIAIYAFVKSRQLGPPPEPPEPSTEEDTLAARMNASVYDMSVRTYQMSKTVDRQFMVLMVALNVLYTVLRFVG